MNDAYWIRTDRVNRRVVFPCTRNVSEGEIRLQERELEAAGTQGRARLSQRGRCVYIYIYTCTGIDGATTVDVCDSNEEKAYFSEFLVQ